MLYFPNHDILFRNSMSYKPNNYRGVKFPQNLLALMVKIFHLDAKNDEKVKKVLKISLALSLSLLANVSRQVEFYIPELAVCKSLDSCIFVDFEPGDLAWAKVKGYNWWPSLVCNDPVETVCIKTLNNKTQCHVQFFDDRRSRAWVLAKLVP